MNMISGLFSQKAFQKFIVAIGLVGCAPAYGQQAALYVSPHGKNENPGSLSSPLKTLQGAVDRLATVKEKKIIIYLRGGIYEPEKTIEITPAVLAGHQLQISAYGNEEPVLSGAKRFYPKWRPWKNKILVARLEKGLSIDELFCNGQSLPMARYPNYDSTKAIFHGTAADAISASRVKGWRNPAGAYVHALHEGMWGGFHYLVEGKDSNGNLQLSGGWQNNRPSPMHKSYRFVENVFEELDAPGEWYYDAVEGLLYLFPPKGINENKAVFARSVLGELISIRGDETNPVEDVTIHGLAFTETKRTFMLTREPLLRSDWTIYRGGAVFIEGGTQIHLTDCRFHDLGGNAIFVSRFNRAVDISGNLIHQIGGNAICFVGSPDAVRSPSFRYEQFVPWSQMDMTTGPKTNEYPSDCRAYDNLIYDIGTIEKQVAGVEISMSMHITISHNTIYNVPRAGINIGDGCWGGDTLEFNDVFNTVLETGDHGAFNSWGRDRYWLPDKKKVDSMVELHPDLPLKDAVETIVLRNNRFYCTHGWDIDLDDGSTNYHIYDNVCLNGGLKLREGFDRVVENNVIVNNSFHPHVWFNNSQDVFKHNIVMADYAPIMMDHWGKEVDSNFFLQKSSLEAARKNGTDAHSLSGNPGFVNPDAGNYNVKAESAAKNIGFKNFPVNEFGVLSKRLRVLAAKAPVASVKYLQSEKPGATTSWLGASIKNIETPGEQSASGLPDKNGVLILRVARGSLPD
ncbi:MAG: right-handed parallel beta-helix repeat-containing protein, partial [Bacteroidota bacterium]|nr:right-handed parallel beta-helix repeat-containing protein [Bacteroidota bacterium]